MSADTPTSGNPDDGPNEAGAKSSMTGAHATGAAGNIATGITAGSLRGVEARANAGDINASQEPPIPGPHELPKIQIPEPQEIPIPPMFTDWAVPFQTQSGRAFSAGAFNSAAFNTAAYNEVPFQFAEAARPGRAVIAEAVRAISRTIASNPGLIRTTARGLAAEFAREVEDRQRTKPNGKEALERYERLISFLDTTARGFTELADALDEGMAAKSDVVEPVFLGKAAAIAHQLQSDCSAWLADNHGMIIEGAVKIGLFGYGMMFLGLLGAEHNLAAVGAVGTIVATLGKRSRKDS